METKICLKCNISKEESNFQKGRNVCKNCLSIQKKLAREKQIERLKKEIKDQELKGNFDLKLCFKCLKLRHKTNDFKTTESNLCIPCIDTVTGILNDPEKLNSLRKCPECNKIKKEYQFTSFVFENGKKVDRCKGCQSNINSKKWALRNKESEILRKKKYQIGQLRPWTLLTDDQIRETKRKYRISPKGTFVGLKSDAKRRKKEILITEEEFIAWHKEQPQECYYCKRTTEECLTDYSGSIRLTVDRKDNNLHYVNGNLALACFTCNFIKTDFFTEEEMLRVIGPIIALKLKTKGESISEFHLQELTEVVKALLQKS
jgi:hypothetical protein